MDDDTFETLLTIEDEEGPRPVRRTLNEKYDALGPRLDPRPVNKKNEKLPSFAYETSNVFTKTNIRTLTYEQYVEITDCERVPEEFLLLISPSPKCMGRLIPCSEYNLVVGQWKTRRFDRFQKTHRLFRTLLRIRRRGIQEKVVDGDDDDDDDVDDNVIVDIYADVGEDEDDDEIKNKLLLLPTFPIVQRYNKEMTKLWRLVYTNPIDPYTNTPPYPETYISPDVSSRTWMSCHKPSFEQWKLFDGNLYKEEPLHDQICVERDDTGTMYVARQHINDKVKRHLYYLKMVESIEREGKICHGPAKDNESNCPHSSHLFRKYEACRNNDAEKVRFVSQNLQNDHGIRMDGTDWIRAPNGTVQKKTNNFATHKKVKGDIFDGETYNNQNYHHRCIGCHIRVGIWEEQQIRDDDSFNFRGVEHKHRNLLNDRFELQAQKCKGIYVEGDGECPNQEYLNEQSLKFPSANLSKRLLEFIMQNLQFSHTHRRDGEEGHTRTTSIFQQSIIRFLNATNNDDEGDVRCNACAKECSSQETWYKLMKDNPCLLLWGYLEYFYNEHQWFFRQRPGTPKLLDVPFELGFKVGDTFEVDFGGKKYTGKLHQYYYRHTDIVVVTNEIVRKVTVPIHTIFYVPCKEDDQTSAESKDDKDEDNVEWVQCDKCEKWRTLPPDMSADELPDIWNCTMNTWKPASARCTADEDTIDTQHHEVDEVGACEWQLRQQHAGKYSFRQMIFGTGARKHNRPMSERSRAAESLFTQPPSLDEENPPHPTTQYSKSSAFLPRMSNFQKANAAEEKTTALGIFDVLRNSQLWDELRQLEHTPPPPAGKVLFSSLSSSSSSSNTLAGGGNSSHHQQGTTYDSLSEDVKHTMQDVVLQILDFNVMTGEEVIGKAQMQSSSSVSSNTIQGCCNVDIIIHTLLDLVRDGIVEMATLRNPLTPVSHWVPKYRRVRTNRAREAVAAIKASRCMKIAKPWKQQRKSNDSTTTPTTTTEWITGGQS